MAAHHRKQHQVAPCLRWLETKFNITDSDDCLDYYHTVRSKIQEQMYAKGLGDSKNPWLKGPSSHSLKAACLELRNLHPGIDFFKDYKFEESEWLYICHTVVFTMRMTNKFYADKRKASSQLSVTTKRKRSDEGDGGSVVEGGEDHMINFTQKISCMPKDDHSQKFFLRAGIVAGVSSSKQRFSIKFLKLDTFLDLIKQRSTFHDKQNLTVGYTEVDCDSPGKDIWVRVTTDWHFQVGIRQMMNANKDVEFFVDDDGIESQAPQNGVVIKTETNAAGSRDVGTQTVGSPDGPSYDNDDHQIILRINLQ